MSSAAPQVRPVQFESDSIGKLPKSVNMFRGDVNFTKTLVQLPGKPGDNALAVTLSIQCQSNVSQDATVWNLDAPTGVLGLGWVLAPEKIEAQTNGALSPAAMQYALSSQGSSNNLIPDDTPWIRLTLDSSTLASLAPGTVSADVVAAFAANGIALAPTSVVSGSSSSWTISDSVNERVYTTQGSDVLDGGEQFQLHNYEFWKISYYPAYERWEITTDSGQIRSYGGGVTQVGKFNASAGNSIEWGVKWGGASGNWTGPSQVTTGQMQYARAWNLAFQRDFWGAQVAYAYNGGPQFAQRTSAGLLPNNVEQQVGVGGLPYTKAVYPTSITDVFGRTVNFTYGFKSFYSAAQEYMDPHFALELASEAETLPSNLGTPNAYQDCYQVLYLSGMSVANAQQQPLYSLAFEYYPPAAVSTIPAALQAQCVKRQLKSVTEFNASGMAMPPYSFDYYMSAADGPNLGALKSVTYPQGGTGAWTYSTLETACNRSYTLDMPTAVVGENATPFVWFGQDFVVSVWLSQDTTSASIDVYTWNGSWQPAWESPQTLFSNAQNPIVLSTVQAVVNSVSFAVSFQTQDGNSRFAVFSRNPHKTAAWEAPDAQPDPISGPVTLTGGNAFLLVIANYSNSLYRWTWDWRTGWSGFNTAVSTSDAYVFTLASGEYYLLAESAQEGTELSLHWLDSSGTWHDNQPASFDWSIGNNNPAWTMMWASGASLAAISVGDPGGGTYSVQLVRWDSSYNFTDTSLVQNLQVEAIDAGQAFPPTPVVASNGFVAVRQNLFRFDGQTWQTAGFDTYYDTSGWLGFAYGNDFAVQATNNLSDVPTSLLAYDPNGSGFASSPLPIDTELPDGPIQLQGWPTASGQDYFTARNALFYRGNSTDWTAPIQTPAATLPSSVDNSTVASQTVVNQGPYFLSYLLANSDSTQDAVQLLTLQNGTATALQPLNATAYSAKGVPGGSPAGLAAFVTYPANEGGYTLATSLTLYRYAGQAISGPITAYPATRLDVDDGFGRTYSVAYEYNAATSACEPTGKVVKYYESAVYSGTDDPSSSEFGRTVYTYQNGTTSGSNYDMLDGLLIQKAGFKGASCFAAQYSSSLGLDPSGPLNTPVPVQPALVAEFAAAGVTLESTATIQMVQIDDVYTYWAIASGAEQFNVTYSGDPNSATGVRGFAGAPVESVTIGWTVYTERNSNPLTPDSEPLQLNGGYPRPTQSIGRKDNVPLTTSFSYLPAPVNGVPFPAPYYGGMMTRTWSVPNIHGSADVHVLTNRYGSAQYPGFLQANWLSPVVATVQTVASGGRKPVTTSSTATTYGGYTQTGGAGLTLPVTTQQWWWIGDSGGTDDGTFPFHGTPDPSLWRLKSAANVFSNAGTLLESTDAGGIRHSAVYDKSGQNTVAMISNASFSLSQAAFAGFESYEDLSAWTLTGGATWTSSEAHTGVSSASIPGGGGLSRAVLAPDPARILFFSAWYKTSSGYAGSGGWTIEARNGGVALGSAVTLPFADTNGVWVYQSAALNLPEWLGTASAVDLTVTISAANSAGTVFVDDVSSIPLATRFKASAYESSTMLALSRLDATGKVWHEIRDAFLRHIGGTDATGAPRSLQLTYLSTTGNNGAFSGADPNASIAIKAFESGMYETFNDSTSWMADWTATPSASFTSGGGALRHGSSASSATLLSNSAPPPSGMAMFVELVSLDGKPIQLTDNFSVIAGDSATFTWSVSSAQWTLSLNGSAFSALAEASGPPNACLVAQVGGYLLFYVNSQLLFSQKAAVSGSVGIVTGNNAIGFRNLALLCAPALKAQYSDATGAAVQAHALTAEGYVAKQFIRDARAKVVVTTKTAPAAFGSGTSLPVPAYRPGFVDVQAFLGNLDGSGLMTGDVNDWYNGSNGTNDQGYPYTRTRLEASPLARVMEFGYAGSEQAIVDPDSTSEESRSTVQLSYSANSGALPYGVDLEEGSFHVSTRTSQLKATNTSYLDVSKNQVATFSEVPGSNGALSLTAPAFGNGLSSAGVILPNRYALTQPEQETSQSYNSLGQVVGTASPDNGRAKFIYNSGGMVRFTQDAVGAEQGYAVYFTYDSLGRQTARGTFPFDWTDESRGQLQTYADEASWPEGQSQVPYTQQRAWAWDGDGSDPNSLNRLVSAQSITGTGASQVTFSESYVWTNRGLPQSRSNTVTVGSNPVSTFTVTMEHDLEARLTSVGYPAAQQTGLTSVNYAYTGFNKVASITDQDDNLIVSYDYDAMGNLAGCTLASAGTTGTATVDSPSRLTGVAVTSPSASFRYGIAYQADSNVHTFTDSTVGGSVSTGGAVTYAYDGLQRIQSATDTAGLRDLSVGFAAPSGSLDLNGNIRQLTAGSAPQATLGYQGNTNTLATYQPADSAAATYTFQKNGTLESRTGNGTLPDLAITYMSGSTLPDTATNGTSGVSLTFGYDAHGYRIFKQSSSDPKPTIYAQGGGAGPLAMIDGQGVATAYVYGPTGLVAMVRGGKTYTVVTDYLCSPRAVLDSSGALVAAYMFNALGQAVAVSEPSTGFIPFGFTGQEFDRELGLYNFNARLYDPSTARFLSPDPRGQYASPFVYVGNQVTMLTDPTGQISTLAAAAIDTTLAFVMVAAIVATAGAAAFLVPAALTAGGTVAAVATGALIGAVGGAIGGAAWGGFYYTATTPPGSWDPTDFAKGMAISGIAGAVGGGLTGGISALGAGVGDALESTAEMEAKPMREGRGSGSEVDNASNVSSDSENAQVSDASSPSAPQASDGPPQPESTASKAWNGAKNFAGSRKYNLMGGAIGGAAKGFTTQVLTNVENKQPLLYGVLLATLEDVAFGAAPGLLGADLGAGGAASTQAMIGDVMSAFVEEPLWYGVAVTGSVVAAGASTAMFYAEQTLYPYGLFQS